VMESVRVGSILIGGEYPLVLIAGPCVIESEGLVMQTAQKLKEITSRVDMPLIFKSSYDKANRSSIDSYRGPGLREGLAILQRVKQELGIPVLSDVHETYQIEEAADVLDVIQIPAFLCRQTDLLVTAGRTGRTVNIKKGQFMAPQDMDAAARKVETAGDSRVIITERGTTFGYHNLVVDMRSLGNIRESGRPVVFDATHSVQLPAAQGTASGGERKFIPLLARAATAAGIDGLFMEVHPEPDKALCDGPNMWPLNRLEPLLLQIKALDGSLKSKNFKDLEA
jgi:2-dehydro-3-deoxyphosphooctonate aldolase (KDO 8-P synthase)